MTILSIRAVKALYPKAKELFKTVETIVFICENTIIKSNLTDDFIQEEYDAMKKANLGRLCEEVSLTKIEGKNCLIMPKLKVFKKSADKEKNSLYLRHLMEDLSKMHKNGVLHLDIKPPNIMYDEESDRLVYIDYGISAIFELDEEEPHSTEVYVEHDVCSRAYRPPEAFDGPIDKDEDKEDMDNINFMGWNHGTDELERCDYALEFKVTPAVDVYALAISALEIFDDDLPLRERRILRLMSDPDFSTRVNIDEAISMMG